MAGLSPSRIVRVTINLSPKAAQYRNFGALLIIGSTPGVIDTTERQRSYTGLDGVASDFGTSAPEYKAARLFFSQAPQPAQLYVGRWAQSATAGVLHGGTLAAADQLLSVFTGITTGSLTIAIDGAAATTITGLNFSAALNLNGVAAIVDTALAGATVTWDATRARFDIVSGSTGATSSIGFATTPGSGVNIAPFFKLRSTDGGNTVVGIVAETADTCVAAFADRFRSWYGLMFAPVTPLTDAQHITVAQFIEGSARSRIYGATIGASSTILNGADATDLASQFKTLNLERTFSLYSTSDAYAVATIFGRAFTVNFAANNSTITLKFKQAPGLAAELLTDSQANTLELKNANVFVQYDNDTAIIEQGVMANGYYIDEVHGTDAFQDALQVDLYNRLYQAKTKIPQTDDGVHSLVTTAEATCSRYRFNGLLAPGVWNADGFGSINQGDVLDKGYYIYAAPVATQGQADREARKSPPIQIAAKLAGAIHSVDVLVSVNR